MMSRTAKNYDKWYNLYLEPLGIYPMDKLGIKDDTFHTTEDTYLINIQTTRPTGHLF